ncbi:2-hexaprenyl-6-methoxy-1,4-benzoquinone methyltransferase [Saguinus oedipus]|uniref:2-hexaprenyl-6-methoxy-1,4-benzoquinone methyltransferase n=1 Tax=Saguinus oedipus TaxID=9490 RepID=A0ABQ9UCP1_SAGOE|nr:2-hexaprenyl-6-methoxy-1,4-benzoquinone methyltransferase [Saguinus oedipus]
MPGCQLLGLHGSWPGAPLSALLRSGQWKRTSGFRLCQRGKGGNVHQVFESVAKKYDVMNDMMSLGIHRLWKDLLLLKMHLLPGTQLLDIAGGTEIAKEYQNEEDSLGGSHVMVCDINKKMLKVGKPKALAQGYRAELTWVLGDDEELPFDDDKFDIYTIAFGMWNVTHIDQALQEAIVC